MISHFWNLCRACPALDVDKLHSEYRSTYRWHEYTPKHNQLVVRKPPLPNSGSGIDGSDFPRKKKHPDVAYKSHDIFESASVQHRPADRLSRMDREAAAMQRRSQSEGPVKRNPLFQSEYRVQFASSRRGRDRAEDNDIRPQESRPQVSFPPPAPSSTWHRRQTSLKSRDGKDGKDDQDQVREPKKSISMGQIQPTGNNPPSAQKPTSLGIQDGQDLNGNADVVDGLSSRTESPARRREYKSEYKNKYRPFSQYEYVGDGKFHNTSDSPPSETDGPSSLVSTGEKGEGEPWYKEVQELRKAANDYKCRGWGTDLVPAHMSDIYSQQLQLHDQAAKRDSLSALALAISSPRSLSNKDSKERENQQHKTGSGAKTPRPRTAPPKPPKKMLSRPESAQSTPTPRLDKDLGTAGRLSVSPGRTGARDGNSRLGLDPSKSAVRQRPTTLNTTSKPKISSKIKEDKKTKDTKNKITKQEEKPVKQDKPVDKKLENLKSDVSKRSISKPTSKGASRDTSRPPSAIENHMDYFREPVVKSPPEPTRVKSPEQLLIRSPDPINWTVPLDTGKTFSVTQSVRDNDSARNSPMSDHSSHFDSVTGTAINLGMHSVNDKGSLLYPKVSALAREAKELQGKSNQKKEEQNSEGAEKSMNGVHETGNNKCLEDPTFTFDEPTAISKPEPVKPAASAANNKTPIDQPSINKAPLDAASVNKTSTDPAPISAAQMTAAPVVAAPIATAPVAAAHTVPAPTVAAPVETPKSTPSSIPVAKKPSYRVLEDPDMDLPPMKPSPYKVLEDPGMSMTASIYQPSASSTDIGKL